MFPYVFAPDKALKGFVPGIFDNSTLFRQWVAYYSTPSCCYVATGCSRVVLALHNRPEP